MEPIPQQHGGPNQGNLDEIRDALRDQGWEVLKFHGNRFQAGIPDLYAMRKGIGKWIEVKSPGAMKLTRAQKMIFPQYERGGVPVYVLVSVDELHLLNEAGNWRRALPKKWRDHDFNTDPLEGWGDE